MTNKEILKKQIIYRSTHRGTKEMDILLGSFVKKNINSFEDFELIELNNLMKTDDEILRKWIFEENNKSLLPINKVSILLKKFKL
tara:strand:- start:50 stop:304 length:255 start_codon:yes stop_codon:yes gene_type:complete